MIINRRNFLIAASTGAALSLPLARSVFAQDNYPNRPVSFIIGNPPGGDDDTLSRFIAEQIRADLGQTVIVDNRGGGATTVAGNLVASSDPDGYRILCLTTSGIVQTVLRDNLPYNLDSFAPIVGIGGYPMALVVSGQGDIKTMDDLIKVAKSPDGITFGSAGAGTLAHLTAVRFLKEIGGNGVHVSYRNNPEGLQALGGGFIQMMFPSAREAATLSANGLLRVLAVTSPERTSNLPDTPTMRELGHPDIDSMLWYGYTAPKGTSDAVVKRLSDAIAKGVQSDAFHQKFGPLAFQEQLLTGGELRDFMATQAQRWQAVITENNVKFTD
ncbi:tripartite tricarboxylate transporter substrate binding protein (plasmid) [Sinorhizobium meliloti]|uniref:Bug family tripartite tricarboxylate transporter substrate binding protein n=1 Tax=Rhizobium meliloti TaxID=382 RepID=UPI000B49CFDD|nr:tripartite tricarboxylate transporter substrate binding protein [Sinorhizobium meliloti]ASP74383.1 tripartite tricarboxylate transporter substrate binding protein [Sinorhizobium meliloti]MDE3857472.1 tripartite tricarboxylate transporter substrate binding protein [Sinorhizobium meliloti]MQW49644.1 tripartite tricarboxylate transporter substrate binding protein [Sinorhizobium meliloti]MQW49695.1 tripartite tricarboxylate transporter substrate binding protein [Sinorhizobium meliloti]